MKLSFMLVAVLFTACHSANKGHVSIGVDRTQKLVTITGLPEAATYGLKNDSISREAWQTLLMVCKMPADTELRATAIPQPGSYKLVNDTITFRPDTPFVKGSTYFARYYKFDDRSVDLNMVIKRRKPGETPYTELIFKY